jgi:translation initiation factor 4E
MEAATIETSVETSTPLISKWNLYYHLPQNKTWNLDSYKIIAENLDTAEKVVGINEALSEIVVKYCMLFAMRTGISPMWEDPNNRNGGYFSYKVVNKFVPEVWKIMFYALCGESLCKNPKYSHLINGITVSPKKSFCIIKIWLKDLSMQDGNQIIDIPKLTKNGVSFQPHKPEF